MPPILPRLQIVPVYVGLSSAIDVESVAEIVEEGDAELVTSFEAAKVSNLGHPD